MTRHQICCVIALVLALLSIFAPTALPLLAVAVMFLAIGPLV